MKECLQVLDIVMLSTVLVCAFDALREVTPWKEPCRAVAFALVTIGSFGWIAYDLHGLPVYWWAFSLHTGFALYAVLLFRGRSMRRRHTDRFIPHVPPSRQI
jgi:hypothetical protein